MEYQIDNSNIFQKENKQEAMLRGERLIERFCSGKNKIYLIKLSDALNLKASYGDVYGLRDGNISDEETQKVINTLPTLSGLMEESGIQKYNIYSSPNMTNEYGIALYGSIPYLALKIYRS